MISNKLSLIDEIEKGYPITHYAKTVPVVQDKIVSWKSDADDKIRISLGSDKQHSHGDSLVFIQRHLNFFYKSSNCKFVLPHNALTVSYSVTPFKAGKGAQEFVLKDKKLPENGYFTYQMLSRNVQATYYNEGGAQFIAGICYYLNSHGDTDVNIKIDERVMHEAIWGWEEYPQGNRYNVGFFDSDRIYGRFCKTAKKQVCVKLEEGKDAVHRVYNYRTWKYELKECEECRDEVKKYKYPVPVKNVKKEEKAVSTEKTAEKVEQKEVVKAEEVKKVELVAEKPVEKSPTPVVTPVEVAVAGKTDGVKPDTAKTTVAQVTEKLDHLEIKKEEEEEFTDEEEEETSDEEDEEEEEEEDDDCSVISDESDYSYCKD